MWVPALPGSFSSSRTWSGKTCLSSKMRLVGPLSLKMSRPSSAEVAFVRTASATGVRRVRRAAAPAGRSTQPLAAALSIVQAGQLRHGSSLLHEEEE